MKCEKIEELLSPYLENELSPEEKKLVQEHLESCKSCRILFSSLAEAKRSLSDFPQLEVSRSLLDRLYSIPAKKKRFRLSFDFLLRPSLQPVLAAATIFLTLISFYAFNPNRKAIDKSIDRQFHLGLNKVEKLYAKAESFTSSLGEYKDNILVSLKNMKIFGGNEK
jgi:predicted anti-sigma-YlaC factor YlaD